MVKLKQCELIIEEGISKKGKPYYALYLVTEKNDKIFLTFVKKNIFDNLQLPDLML